MTNYFLSLKLIINQEFFL